MLLRGVIRGNRARKHGCNRPNFRDSNSKRRNISIPKSHIGNYEIIHNFLSRKVQGKALMILKPGREVPIETIDEDR